MVVISHQLSVIRNVLSGVLIGALVFTKAATSDSLIQTQKELSEHLKPRPKNLLKTSGQASSLFFEGHAEGWHWYESQESEIRKQGSGKKQEKSPTEVIEEQRKEIEQKLHAAIVEPTRENLVAYILAQRALMDQSQRFSESWKKVVMTSPSLDETLIHPVDQNARPIYYLEKSKDLQDKIKKLASEYGLFFFFRKNCPYCHGFAPIVKSFAKTYGWSLLPVSLDGGTLPEFPHAKKDNGIAESLGVSHVPALIALHPKSGKFIPLAYGMVSISEIEERVELLTKYPISVDHPYQVGDLIR